MTDKQTLSAKYDALLNHLQSYEKLSVAFSGGVDSTLLIRAAFDALGKNALALTARAAMVSPREEQDAKDFAKQVGIAHEWVDLDAAMIPHFFDNPQDRCYHCIKALMTALRERADLRQKAPLCEASNVDDLDDLRPGKRAIEELGILSPFLELGFRKADIRELSQMLDLPSANKPSFACLASRVPYETPITLEKLRQIAEAEDYLFSLGFAQLRVRHHGQIARIELLEEDFPRLIEKREEVDKKLRALGFSFVCLDLGGFFSGRMNFA